MRDNVCAVGQQTLNLRPESSKGTNSVISKSIQPMNITSGGQAVLETIMDEMVKKQQTHKMSSAVLEKARLQKIHASKMRKKHMR